VKRRAGGSDVSGNWGNLQGLPLFNEGWGTYSRKNTSRKMGKMTGQKGENNSATSSVDRPLKRGRKIPRRVQKSKGKLLFGGESEVHSSVTVLGMRPVKRAGGTVV